MSREWVSFSSKLPRTNFRHHASSTQGSSTQEHSQLQVSKHEDAVAIFRKLLEGKVVDYEVVSFEVYNNHHKLRSKAFAGFSFLVHKNSVRSAGWILCTYALSRCCPLDKAVRVFNVSRGGTSSLSRHTETHERSAAPGALEVHQKLSAGERDSLAHAAVTAVVKDQLPFSFLENQKGLQCFVEAIFRAGQRTAAGVSVNSKELLVSSTTIRNHLTRRVGESRKQFSSDVVPTIISNGGGITCDGLKHKLVEGAETADNLRTVLSDGVQSRYGVTLDDLLEKNTFVTDCASTLPCVVGASSSSNKVSLSYKWMGCVSHQLNTCMKKVVGDKCPAREPFKTIQSNLQAAKTIVRIFKQFNISMQCGLKLVQEIETRFSTTFLVVQRFLRCASEITKIIRAQPASSPLRAALQDLEHDIAADGAPLFPALNAIFIACRPLKHMQTAMEASRKPTLHRLIPMIEYCKKYLLKLSQGNMLTALVPSIEEADRQISCNGLYFRELGRLMLEELCNIEIHPLWSAGCVLHPRLRLMTCVPDPVRREKYIREGKAEVRRLMNAERGTFKNAIGEASETTGQTERAEHDERRLVAATRNDLQCSLETALDCPTPQPSYVDEMSRYIRSAVPDDLSDIMAEDDLGALRWWVKMRNDYPILHKVAI